MSKAQAQEDLFSKPTKQHNVSQHQPINQTQKNEPLQSWQCASEPEIHNSNSGSKPLGQSLGSKVGQKSKTELEI